VGSTPGRRKIPPRPDALCVHSVVPLDLTKTRVATFGLISLAWDFAGVRSADQISFQVLVLGHCPHGPQVLFYV
jgi:hypothetical protein